MSLDLSIVIPAYNEEARLAPTVLGLLDVIAEQGYRAEILVVDDGSTDGTARLVQEMATTNPAIRLIDGRPNRGKGHAVRIGMLAARGAVRVFCDADGSTPARELPRLVAALAEGDIAIGSRYLGRTGGTDQPLWRRLWSRLAHHLVQRALVPGVVDAHCGFKAFRAAAAVDLFGRAEIDGWSFDLEILALAVRRGHAILELPVEWHDDQRSRVRPLQDLARVIREVATIRRRLAV